jgi:hypothetical protein
MLLVPRSVTAERASCGLNNTGSCVSGPPDCLSATRWRVWRADLCLCGAYLARLHTASALLPAVEAGFSYRSWSAVRVKKRFCSAPSAFGNVLAST